MSKKQSMKLSDYLKENRIIAAEFARKIGVTTMAVSYWVNGKRMPEPEHIVKIYKETDGMVDANSFIDYS